MTSIMFKCVSSSQSLQIEGDTITLTCRHVAYALGAGLTEPRRPPKWPAEETFSVDLLQMVDFKNSRRWKQPTLEGPARPCGRVWHGWTRHSRIAQDMLDNGLDTVTLVQRNRTAVYPGEWYAATQRGKS